MKRKVAQCSSHRKLANKTLHERNETKADCRVQGVLYHGNALPMQQLRARRFNRVTDLHKDHILTHKTSLHNRSNAHRVPQIE